MAKSPKITHTIGVVFDAFDTGVAHPELSASEASDRCEELQMHVDEVIDYVHEAASTLGLRNITFTMEPHESYPRVLQYRLLLEGEKRLPENEKRSDRLLRRLLDELHSNIHLAIRHTSLELPEAEA